MKTISKLTAILVTLFAMSANGQTEFNFDKIKIAGSASVELKQGETNAVSGEGDVKGVYTMGDNGWLIINGKKGDEIAVTARQIKKIDLAGSGKLETEGVFKADKIDILVSGIGKVEMDLDVTEVESKISGTGKIELKGKADQLRIDISGAGKVDAENLKSKNGIVNISGSGKCLVNVIDELTTNISGSGSVYYVTTPAKLNKNITGIGKVGDANTSVQDTTKIMLRKKKLLLIDDEGENVRQSFKEALSKKSQGLSSHWAGFELGVNMLADSDFNTDAPEGYDYLKLRTEKSIAVNFNLLNYDINLVKKHVMLVTGLGFTINNYRFKSDSYLLPATDSVIAFLDPSIDVKKNKLVANYLTVPLLLEFNTSSNPNRTVHLAMGVIGGLRLGSHVKLVKEVNGDDTKTKIRDDFNLNPWRYDATVRVGYRNFTLFGSYGLTSLFDKDKGPEVSPLTLGVKLVGW
jgi:hypothetical protein